MGTNGEKTTGSPLGQGEHNRSPLCEWAVELKYRAFPVTRGNGSKYMYFKEIYNAKGTGFMQQLALVENQLYDKYGMLISFLEKEGLTGKKLDKKRVSQMYEEISDMIQRAYGKL